MKKIRILYLLHVERECCRLTREDDLRQRPASDVTGGQRGGQGQEERQAGGGAGRDGAASHQGGGAPRPPPRPAGTQLSQRGSRRHFKSRSQAKLEFQV